MSKIKFQIKSKRKNSNIKTLYLKFGFWILVFVCHLSFGFWNSPTVHANDTYYNFPASFSDGTSAVLALPFDRIHSITQLDLGGDGTSELLIGSPPGQTGKVFLIRQDGSIINSWNAYDENFSGGVNVAAADFDYDSRPEIVTAPASAGGPHVRIFDGFGIPKISPGFFADDKNYTQGVSISIKKFTDNKPPAISTIIKNEKTSIFKIFTIAGELVRSYPIEEKQEQAETVQIPIRKLGQTMTLSLPKKVRSIKTKEKTIIIDLSDQNFSYYENGFRMNTFKTSTGKRWYKTPVGEYKILNKAELAYSRTYGLYMPYWMAFTARGHGIHELPYWPNGFREGEDHLGTAVSHGCVRLGIGAAAEIYDWAEIGTAVIVQE